MGTKKISAFDANTDPLGTDKLVILDDPGGSPNAETITMNKLFASCRVYNNANIEIDTATSTAITFNSEYWDTDGMHSTASNTSRITCVTAGKYLIGGIVRFEAHATGIRRLSIILNAATTIAFVMHDIDAASDHTYPISTIYDLAANDYVELYAYQTSGGGLDVVYGAAYSPVFWAVRVG